MTSSSNEKSFGVVPVRRQKGKDLFLLVRHHAGHWAFPKGHAEKGETEEETALRELAEETGIRDCRLVPGASFAESYAVPEKPVRKTVKYFLGIVGTAAVRVQEEEIADFKWLEAAAARKLMTFDEGPKILDQAVKIMASNHA